MSRRHILYFLYNCVTYVDWRSRKFVRDYGPRLAAFFEDAGELALRPITAPIEIVGSAQRGFGVPELVSKLALSSVFVVGALGVYDIALELGTKVVGPRNCKSCSGWQALCCNMCKGTGEVPYRVKDFNRRGWKATAKNVAEAISKNHAELVHIDPAMEPSFPLPYKLCPRCDGTGIVHCQECKSHGSGLRISVDNIMEPPQKAYNILRKIDYPYENIVDSMKDPKIAAFWLITMPQLMGGFNYDEDVKQKIWWAYNESMRYDRLRDLVAKREPGWETLQKALISLNPVRAREDPVIVRNVPYYKAKKALEAEVMKLDVPPRPYTWGLQELNLPLNETSWTKEELKDPKKLLEMTTLLNAQKDMAEKVLNAQWEANWRQQKLNELLVEKALPYIQNMDMDVLPEPFIIPSPTKKKRWWFF